MDFSPAVKAGSVSALNMSTFSTNKSNYTGSHSPTTPQMSRVLSRAPEANNEPSGEKAMARTPAPCDSCRISEPSAQRHKPMVPSYEPEAKIEPSSEKASEPIQDVCVSSVRNNSPSLVRHTRMSASRQPEMTE